MYRHPPGPVGDVSRFGIARHLRGPAAPLGAAVRHNFVACWARKNSPAASKSRLVFPQQVRLISDLFPAGRDFSGKILYSYVQCLHLIGGDP